jgi:hypothetical protein
MVRRALGVGAAALAVAALVVPAASAARVVVATAATRTAVVFVVGAGFAPPNEFCRPVRLRVDGTLVPLRSRRADEAGTWVLAFRASQPVGVHRLVLSQVCESGRDGSLRTTSASGSLRIT